MKLTVNDRKYKLLTDFYLHVYDDKQILCDYTYALRIKDLKKFIKRDKDTVVVHQDIIRLLMYFGRNNLATAYEQINTTEALTFEETDFTVEFVLGNILKNIEYQFNPNDINTVYTRFLNNTCLDLIHLEESGNRELIIYQKIEKYLRKEY